MNKRRMRIAELLIMVGLICLIGTNTAAQKPEEESRLKSLHNITAVRVQVVDFTSNFKAELHKAGLTENLLETIARRRIEAAGIKVLRETEPDASEQVGIVLLSLQAHSPISARKFTMTGEGIEFSAPGGQPPYLYQVRTEFRQKVVLARDTSFGLTSATWSTATFGIKRLKRLTEDIKGQVDEFIEAFLSENK